MSARLPMLLLLVLSLALGPVKAVACAAPTSSLSCPNCCAQQELICCDASESAPASLPASTSPQSIDYRQLAAPVFVFVGLRPLPPVARVGTWKQHPAGLPVPPRLDLNCIRLI